MPETALHFIQNDVLPDLTKNQVLTSYLAHHHGFDQHGGTPSDAQLQGTMQAIVEAAHTAAHLNAWPQASKMTHLDDIVSAIGWLSEQHPQQFKGRSAALFSRDVIDNPQNGEFTREIEFALSAVEKQSPETWAHIQNHTALIMLYFERQCAAEDRVLGLEEGKSFDNKKDEAMLLLLGALGHDIGKVGISPELLHKSTRIAPERLAAAQHDYDLQVPFYPEKAHDMAFLQSANEGKIIFAAQRDKEHFSDDSLILNVGAGYERGEMALTDEQQRQRHNAIWERINEKAQQASLAHWLTADEQQTLTMPKRGTVTDHEMAVIATHDTMSEAFFKNVTLPERFESLPRIVSMDRFRNQHNSAPQLDEKEAKLADIIHATDVLEALMSARSYRSEPMSAPQAIAVMKEQADKGLINPQVIHHLTHNGTLDIYKPQARKLPPQFSELTEAETRMAQRASAGAQPTR